MVSLFLQSQCSSASEPEKKALCKTQMECWKEQHASYTLWNENFQSFILDCSCVQKYSCKYTNVPIEAKYLFNIQQVITEELKNKCKPSTPPSLFNRINWKLVISALRNPPTQARDTQMHNGPNQATFTLQDLEGAAQWLLHFCPAQSKAGTQEIRGRKAGRGGEGGQHWQPVSHDPSSFPCKVTNTWEAGTERCRESISGIHKASGSKESPFPSQQNQFWAAGTAQASCCI